MMSRMPATIPQQLLLLLSLLVSLFPFGVCVGVGVCGGNSGIGGLTHSLNGDGG